MFRFYSKSNNGTRVTVIGQHADNMLKIGVSRCSKSDAFMKDKGVKIAESRINGGKSYMTIPMESCDGKTFNILAKGISERVERTSIVY
jgi:hypothetical protein